MWVDTIAAISTPLGEGGIGIVRISGSESFKIIKKIFKPKYKKEFDVGKGFTMHLGHVYTLEDRMIDEVLISIMVAPKSFTGEDVVEINCHGGLMPLQLTLETVIAAGARIADPGEFSKRAFLNGKIDLSQGEAIIDVIRAKNETGLNNALDHLRGKLSQEINKIRNELLGLLAAIEAAIDFPEEDLDNLTYQEMLLKVNPQVDNLEGLIASFSQGKLVRDGINTAIVGRTNVGKSSLLNVLLGENRAIVTDCPGTTRDTIEEYINLKGFSLKIIDTAGIRNTADLVEKIGVDKSKEIIKKADLVLFVLDISMGITSEDQEIIQSLEEKKTILIINKIDLDEKNEKSKDLADWIKKYPTAYISAKNEIGIEKLESLIISTIMEKKIMTTDSILITNVRHKECLTKALFHLREVLKGIAEGIDLDFLSIDIRGAWEILGEITGDTCDENLIDRIFTDFCIGK